MSRLLLFLFPALLVFAAADPWAKVKDLTTGTELRIYKVGGKQPIMAKMDQLTDESLVVIVKNEETAIPKEQIDRIDYRPEKGRRMTSETKATQDDPNARTISPTRPQPANVPGQSTSSSVNFGKPDFETIYRK